MTNVTNNHSQGNHIVKRLSKGLRKREKQDLPIKDQACLLPDLS
ncbi:hypothetical protein MKY29_13760 [Psychrobacillus sp. FSL K6-2365]